MTTSASSAPFTPSHPFDLPDADITLRSVDNVDFHVHKAILSVASSVFRDMFSLPPPPDDTPLASPRPFVSLTEDSKTLEQLLRFCYPINKPPLRELEDIVPVLKAALKYDMEWPTTLLTGELGKIIPRKPLEVWACACQCGLLDLAQSAAIKVLSETMQGENTKGSRLAKLYEMLESVGLGVLEGVVAGELFRLRESVLSEDREASFVASEPCSTTAGEASPSMTIFYPRIVRPDVVIRCPDTTMHYAHEAILSLHSLVFEVMIHAQRRSQSCEVDKMAQRVELEVEVGSNVLVPLLELCYGRVSDLPSAPSRLAPLLVATNKYQMTQIHKIVQDRWDEMAKTSPLDAYFVAVQHGLNSQARHAARGVLEGPIDGAYARSMKSSSALSYYRLLQYYTSCTVAVNAQVEEAITQWQQAIRNARNQSGSRSSRNHSVQDAGSIEQYILGVTSSEEGPGRELTEVTLRTLLEQSCAHEGSIWPQCSVQPCETIVNALMRLSSDLPAKIAEEISKVRTSMKISGSARRG